LVVISISIDQGRGKVLEDYLKSYIEKKKLSFINLLDPESLVAAKYGVRAIPMSFILNPDGKIVAFVGGSTDWLSKENKTTLEKLIF
jgi:peroxiredoxin